MRCWPNGETQWHAETISAEQLVRETTRLLEHNRFSFTTGCGSKAPTGPGDPPNNLGGLISDPIRSRRQYLKEENVTVPVAQAGVAPLSRSFSHHRERTAPVKAYHCAPPVDGLLPVLHLTYSYRH